MAEFDYPESMEGLLYFTNRKLPDGTKILAYVEKINCDKCGKAKMGKPINEKTGKPKIRSPIYVCPACDHEEKKLDHQAKLSLTVQYTNPEGTELKKTEIPYERKTFQGIPSFVFINEFSGKKMGITKRMKTKKDKEPKA